MKKESQQPSDPQSAKEEIHLPIYHCPSLSSTLCESSQWGKLETRKNESFKFCSFQKIKDMKERQKFDQGKVIKKQVISREEQQNRGRPIKTLDDAKTIISEQSMSSISRPKRVVIEESIIIMKGQDMEIGNEENYQEEELKEWVPSNMNFPHLKRRNTSNDTLQSTEFLIRVSCRPPLLQCLESGLLCHCQILAVERELLNQLKNICHNNILSIYSAQPIHNNDRNLSLVLFEPFAQDFLQFGQNLPEKVFLKYLTEIIKVLASLSEICIYPKVEVSSVLVSNNSIKIKVRPVRKHHLQNQREVAKDCGIYFDELFERICLRRNPCENIALEIEELIHSMITDESYLLDVVYLKLQKLASDTL